MEQTGSYDKAVEFWKNFIDNFYYTKAGRKRKDISNLLTKQNFGKALRYTNIIISSSEATIEAKKGDLNAIGCFLANLKNKIFKGFTNTKGELTVNAQSVIDIIENIQNNIKTYLQSQQQPQQPIQTQQIPVKRTFATMSDLPRESLPQIPIKITQPLQPEYLADYKTLLRGINTKLENSNQYLKDIDTELLNYFRYRRQQQPQNVQPQNVQQPVQNYPRYYGGISGRY